MNLNIWYEAIIYLGVRQCRGIPASIMFVLYSEVGFPCLYSTGSGSSVTKGGPARAIVGTNAKIIRKIALRKIIDGTLLIMINS